MSHVPADSPRGAGERSSVWTFPGMAVASSPDWAPSMTTARRSDGQTSATATSGTKPFVHDGGIKEAKAAAGAPSRTKSADG